jgi:hypothetical protein
MRNLTAYYDLSVSPPTYDFMSFIVCAEMARIKSGADYIDFVIVPGPRHGFRDDNLPPSIEERKLMLQRIIMPMPWLLPSCSSVTIIERGKIFREDGPIFPDGYHPRINPVSYYGLQRMMEAFSADCFPLTLPAESIKGLVTITLRECEYWPERNSKISAWMDIADWIKERGLKPIFIRDTAKAGRNIPGFDCDHDASVDLRRRAYLYASANLNLGVNNGPMWLATAMRQANVMVCNMLAPSCPAARKLHLEGSGLPVGSQIGRAGHRIVWAQDLPQTIIPEIEEW